MNTKKIISAIVGFSFIFTGLTLSDALKPTSMIAAFGVYFFFLYVWWFYVD